MSPDDSMWFRLLAGLLVGLALGSFVTMLSYRAPRRLSIVAPPSHCPKCNTVLKARDLVPVVSWVAAGGKCRHCGAPVGARYVMIEFATAVACLVAFAGFGFEPQLVIALAGIVAVITLAVIYLERGKD